MMPFEVVIELCEIFLRAGVAIALGFIAGVAAGMLLMYVAMRRK